MTQENKNTYKNYLTKNKNNTISMITTNVVVQI